MQINNEENIALTTPDYREELLLLIKGNLPKEEFCEKISEYHENDIANVFPDITQEERLKLYNALDVRVLSDIFSYLDDVEIYVAELENTFVADIIDEMDADDAVDVLEQLTNEKKETILRLLTTDQKQDVKMIASFDDSMIGSKMTTNYIVAKENSSIKQVMKELVSQAAENDNVQKIFIVKDDETLVGVVDLRDLIIARQTQSIDDILCLKYPFFYADTLIEDCIEELKTYNEDEIPILDKNQRLIGVITSGDIVEVVHEEITEDYAKLAGLTDTEDLKEPIFKSIKKRAPWLLILLGLGLIISAIIQSFQNHIPTSLLIIYTFQSLILNMSGNTGTQSLAVTIRVITDEKLTAKEIFSFILKELRVGFFNGLIVGLLSFVAIGLYLEFIAPASIAMLSLSGFTISMCIGLSLLVAMTIASLAGTLIPLLFKKIGIDPAVASGPLITTLNDLIAVCTYYGLSILLFIVLL